MGSGKLIKPVMTFRCDPPVLVVGIITGTSLPSKNARSSIRADRSSSVTRPLVTLTHSTPIVEVLPSLPSSNLLPPPRQWMFPHPPISDCGGWRRWQQSTLAFLGQNKLQLSSSYTGAIHTLPLSKTSFVTARP